MHVVLGRACLGSAPIATLNTSISSHVRFNPTKVFANSSMTVGGSRETVFRLWLSEVESTMPDHVYSSLTVGGSRETVFRLWLSEAAKHHAGSCLQFSDCRLRQQSTMLDHVYSSLTVGGNREIVFRLWLAEAAKHHVGSCLQFSDCRWQQGNIV